MDRASQKLTSKCTNLISNLNANPHTKNFISDVYDSAAEAKNGGIGIFSLAANDLLKEYDDYDDEEDDDTIKIHDDVMISTRHPNSVLPFKPGFLPKTTPRSVRKKPLDPSKLPEFAEEPVDAFIIRGKSAELDCKVRSAVKAYFTCNDEAMAESNLHKVKKTIRVVKLGFKFKLSFLQERDFVEAATGEVMKELRIEITRNMVEEFFGKFTCRCDAWSARGRISSRNVTVETACKSELNNKIITWFPEFSSHIRENLKIPRHEARQVHE